MLKTAAVIAFFALLRSAEYLSSHRHSYDHQSTLLITDIGFDPLLTQVTIMIKSSTGDGTSKRLPNFERPWSVIVKHNYQTLWIK